MDTFTTEDGLVLDAFNSRCHSRETLRAITGRWAPLVLLALDDGITRFGDLHRYIDGSNERMISQTLRDLAAEHLVVRSSDDTGRPLYTLSPGGKDIAQHLRGLLTSVYTHLAGPRPPSAANE